MAYVVTVNVITAPTTRGVIAPAPPDAAEGRCAKVLVDLDKSKWKVSSNEGDFKIKFGCTEGSTRTEQNVDVYLLNGSAEVLYMKHSCPKQLLAHRVLDRQVKGPGLHRMTE